MLEGRKLSPVSWFPSSHFLNSLFIVAMGQQPTEEELFQMISEVDEDMSGAIGQ